MSLFNFGTTRTLHSGDRSDFFIDCDALTDKDIRELAQMIAQRYSFCAIESVHRGGDRLAEALKYYLSSLSGRLLIVDDVLTTGASMESQRAGRDALGIVIFARGPCPEWIKPIFSYWDIVKIGGILLPKEESTH